MNALLLGATAVWAGGTALQVRRLYMNPPLRKRGRLECYTNWELLVEAAMWPRDAAENVREYWEEVVDP